MSRAFVIKREDGLFYNKKKFGVFGELNLATLYKSLKDCKIAINMLLNLSDFKYKPVEVEIREVEDV